MEFRGRTRKDTESEYNSWRADYRHKYRIIKKHEPRILKQSSDAVRRANTAREYSILVEYATIRKSRAR
jgi:hypothetical protein